MNTPLYVLFDFLYLLRFLYRSMADAGVSRRIKASGVKIPVFALVISVLLRATPAVAEYRTQAFPGAHELFAPLLADPTEPQFSFQLGYPVPNDPVARINAGDYLGVYRWALGDVGALQVNIGGSINTRFDATSAHNLQVIDFYGNVPLDLRIGWFSARTMFYHDSSHLGDDYLRVNNIQSVPNTWEALREIMAVQFSKAIRVYGGYTYAERAKPIWSGKQAVQGGTEIYFNTSEHSFWHPYWANDIQAWERTTWDPTWTSQLGFKTGDRFSRGRGITYYLQYRQGPRFEGQFYKIRETVWDLGIKFSLSDHLFTPAALPERTVPLAPSAAPVPTATIVTPAVETSTVPVIPGNLPVAR